MQTRLIQFLQEELQLSTDAISVALRHCSTDPSQLPMILWQYGLVNLEQLNRIWDWQEMPSGNTIPAMHLDYEYVEEA